MPAQVVAVALDLVDLARELGAPRPEHDVGAAVGEDLGERRAPAAGAEDGDAAGSGPLRPSGALAFKAAGLLLVVLRPGPSALAEPSRRAGPPAAR